MVRKEEGLDYEATLLGGLTGAVSANPEPAAGVLALAALLWLVRGAGLLSELREPSWLFGVAAVQLIAATALMANLGPATFLAQLVALAQVAISFLLPGEPTAPYTLCSAAVGVTVIVMTAGEPGATRRYVGLTVGVLALAGAALTLIGAR